jgi:tetratricopeptide (TPR) repeat protein
VAGATLSVLAGLVDKSLLRRNLSGRYEVHELARQYAAAQLAASQQEAPARNRHLAFFMHFAEAAEPQIRSGQQAAQWHEWVEVDHDNIRAALDWSLNGGEFEHGLRIVGALWEFWMDRGIALEGQTQAERFLERPEVAARTFLRARALQTAGACAFYHGHYRTALAWQKETMDIARELGTSGKYVLAMALIGQGYTLSSLQNFDSLEALSREALSLGEDLQDHWVKGHALNHLGAVAWRRGDYASAQRLFLDSFAAFQIDGRGVMRGAPVMRLGTLLFEQGSYATARLYLEQSLTIYEEIGDKVRRGGVLTRLGHVAIKQGNEMEAEELLTKALTLIRETGHLLNQVTPLDALGRLAQRQGDYAHARRLHEESLALSIEMDNLLRIALTLKAFACLAARQGQAQMAVSLFGATEVYPPPSETTFDSNQPFHDQLLDMARTQLGEDAFAAAWAAGKAMTLDEAVALAKALPQS